MSEAVSMYEKAKNKLAAMTGVHKNEVERLKAEYEGKLDALLDRQGREKAEAQRARQEADPAVIMQTRIMEQEFEARNRETRRMVALKRLADAWLAKNEVSEEEVADMSVALYGDHVPPTAHPLRAE